MLTTGRNRTRGRALTGGRTPANRLAAPVLAAWALFAAACGVLSPEEQLLADFFHAARLHDTTVLANIASVDFNPRADGIVQDFEVIRSEASSASGGSDTRLVTVAAQVRTADARTEART